MSKIQETAVEIGLGDVDQLFGIRDAADLRLDQNEV